VGTVMRVKLRKQKKLDIRNRVQSVTEIKEAIQFLYPELTADELQDKLVFILLTIADSEKLQALWNSTNELANKKVDEVTDLYCNFFSEDFNDNNN
jgi:tRNA(His) 5'-end guanylyltransferase